MVETEVTVDSAGVRLAGTLCVPERGGRFPVVVMIHGSGPLDRDANIPGQKLDVFNAIARRLASAGVASIRYDKRGCGKSGGDYYRAGHPDLVRDVIAWVDSAYAGAFEVEASGVFLLGHSEGCIIAPQVFAARPPLAGMALICPFVQPIETILLRQAGQLEREIAAGRGVGGLLRKAMISLAGGASVEKQRCLINRIRTSNQDVIRLRLQKLPARALRDMLALDPPAIFREVTCPVLLIGGEKDLQCDPGDVERIAAIVPGPVESHVMPNLMHLLRLDPGVPSMLGGGALLKSPVASDVLDLVEEWMRRRP